MTFEEITEKLGEHHYFQFGRVDTFRGPIGGISEVTVEKSGGKCYIKDIWVNEARGYQNQLGYSREAIDKILKVADFLLKEGFPFDPKFLQQLTKPQKNLLLEESEIEEMEP
jgi:hypothetical protein